MEKIDLEHRLLKGGPVYMGDIPTYSITLGQMVDFKYGYSVCQQIISLLCMDDDKTTGILKSESEITTWNFIIANMYTEIMDIKNNKVQKEKHNEMLIFSLPLFLEMVFHEKVLFDCEKCSFEIGGKSFVNEDNFDKLRTILKERNCLVDIDEINEYDNPANDMAKKLLEKKKRLNEKIKKLKKENEDEDSVLTICDLISIFAESEHKTLCEVYDGYDMYQFNNQFNRLKIMEDYQVNIKALLAGAKSEDVNLKHWLSKINTKND